MWPPLSPVLSPPSAWRSQDFRDGDGGEKEAGQRAWDPAGHTLMQPVLLAAAYPAHWASLVAQ